MNVRLAVSESDAIGHQQPARGAGAGGCLQGHCCSCYSVHCPSASSCYGNRPFWASHISAWPCLMVGLLGATELFGKPFRALTWNTRIVYFLMRSSKIVSPVRPHLCSCLWGIGETLAWIRAWRHKARSPDVHGASICRRPHRGTAHSSSTGAGQGRGAGPWEKAGGKTLWGPPLRRQRTVLCRKVYMA